MRVLQIFRELTAIPHCSGRTEEMREYIATFAQNHGFKALIDRAGNILCYRSRRSIALQAHYDMVCLGEAPKIEVLEEGGYLKARNSSLGADNGIGVALMLALMEEGVEAEYLFTNDEEIGLVGARNLELKLHAHRLINLDSEEFGAIFVGSAGGLDLEGTLYIERERVEGPFWEISYQGKGGHSGVDIDKPIPNALKELLHYLATQDLRIASIQGGERPNAIPASARAVVWGEVEPREGFTITPVDPLPIIVQDLNLIALLLAIPHGVRGWNRELDLPQMSQNLAIVQTSEERVTLTLSLRAMEKRELERLERENRALLLGFGVEQESHNDYPPWQPQIGEFAREVWRIYSRYTPDLAYRAVHAGLETAIIAQKFPTMEIVSIGPDIEFPHSREERVKIETIQPIYLLLKELLCGGSS
ncbi:MAG: aminoacyl-histidine dipeptidase [Epsilonproteobacteria bacterium]|nr:hypothetical protein [Campylobacterota bacterium]NPA56857.1 aminoacyl-histidine dipeptidase [Campylobacterota bacterium]